MTTAATAKAKPAKPAATKLATKAPAPSAAKAVASKPSSAPSTDGAPDPIFTEWKAGVRIVDLVKSHKLSRAEIRRRLVQGAGSRAAFRELRKAGAGGPITKAAAKPKEEGR